MSLPPYVKSNWLWLSPFFCFKERPEIPTTCRNVQEISTICRIVGLLRTPLLALRFEPTLGLDGPDSIVPLRVDGVGFAPSA